MAADNELEFLKEYNEWCTAKRMVGIDVSPEAFIVDRTKEQAFTMLEKIQDTLKLYEEGTYTAEAVVDYVYGVINGDF